jgi:hypothetical protein
MGIFSFKPKQSPENKKTAFDFFSFDFLKLPDESCTVLDAEFNSGASVVLPFWKDLELDSEGEGLFDQLRINTFQNSNGKNYCFSQSTPKLNVVKFKALVDFYAGILGGDNSGKKSLTGDDIKEMQGGFWGGRFWDKSAHSNAVSINYYDDEGVSLTIFTVQA